TNWHLSAGRAIAVEGVLEKAGVQPVRMGVAGHSEYRPVVSNPAKGGAEANRRVEIYLVPNSYNGPGAAAPEASMEGTKAATPKASTKKPAAGTDKGGAHSTPGNDEPPEAFK